MKNTGIIKQIDALGRMKIPSELCDFFNIKHNDDIIFSQKGKKIILKKSCSYCIFCHSSKNILNFKGQKICNNCIKTIKRGRTMEILKEKELELKKRTYILIEKTKKNYEKYLEERKFLLSLEYLDLKSEEDYDLLNKKIAEIEFKLGSDIDKK